jgi:hypothetical protein
MNNLTNLNYKTIFKVFLFSLFLSVSAYGNAMKPTLSFNANGGVTDMVYSNNILYISTTEGSVDLYDIKQNKIINSIKLKNIKNFLGKEVAPKVYCVDILNDSILFASKEQLGFSNIFKYENGKLTNIIDIKEEKSILRTKWIDKNTIIFATLSNQFYLYDIKNKKIKWEIQVSTSKFSNLVLNEKRDQFLVADESGDLKLHSIKDGSFIKSFDGQNLDNVFQIDLKNNKIITAGQDMRTVIYNENNGNSYYKKARFLIYSAGLSPSGKIGAFAKYENNDVQVFNTSYKNDIIKLTDNIMTISQILFINESEIFVSSDSKQINYYKLK